MLKRAIVAAVCAGVMLGAAATPANAFTTDPPGTMIITNYYSGGTLVGQKWRCDYGGGMWGVATSNWNITFGVC